MKPYRFISFLIVGINGKPEEPFPRCAECVPNSIYNAPGVGFGLSFSSGSAAIHLNNSTVLDIALVSASPDYMTLMARLVASPKPPPLSRWSKWRRSVNKKLGRPATADVGTLADMLISLRNATSAAIASPLDRVSVAHQPIPGLTEYDLSDALEYAGLRPWLSSELPRPKIGWPPLPEAGMYPTHLTEGHAVFAAHGHGLCESYKNLFDCWEEEEKMPVEMVLVAGFTKGDLRAEAMRIGVPFDWFQNVMERFVDLTAGLDAIDKFDSEEAFWAYIRNRLEELVTRLPSRLTMVLLTGEEATHPRFLGSLRDALVNGTEKALVVDGQGGVINPAFAHARGAAQYSRWRQEAPVGCEEPENCSH
ncbi:hypothetical protein B0J13DRAFT_128802 [Dactylonectria estremocensis]|uniref:Uncharacterized protein n=1 Tax=Dactylonectria estremocensis TaxID=1079267 RepID=A0A9P9FFH1_9HYPO|nr:hypothetical protein B0J13DRAFT_128802 [Dactylonectria estremocensis]